MSWESKVNIKQVMEIRSRTLCYFGVGALQKVNDICDWLKKQGIDKVLIVTDKIVYKVTGVWDVLEPAMKARGIAMRQEVYTIEVTEEEQLAGWNHAGLGEDGDLFADTVCIDVGDMDNDDDIISVELFCVFEELDGERSEAKMLVDIEIGQFKAWQVRAGELSVSDIVNAAWETWGLYIY